MYGTQRNELRKPVNNQRHETQDNHEDGPRNYRNPDPLNCGIEGKSATITMIDGRIESGIVKVMGQYSISMEAANKRILIVNKSAIITVSVNL
jgi:sRNA-binding regulator protein Hfq